MKDTRELVDLLLKDTDLQLTISRSEEIELDTVNIVMRIKERMARIEQEAGDIAAYVPLEGDRKPVFPRWLGPEITATTTLLVAALNDWERPQDQLSHAARILQRAMYGSEHAPADWWDTMTGANMAYAIGYTHREVPLAVAPRVLRVTRPGVHWLRVNKGLELTDSSFYAHIRGSQEWKQSVRP